MKKQTEKIEFDDFSLLWKDNHNIKRNTILLDENIMKDLGLYDICKTVTETQEEYEYMLVQMQNLCCNSNDIFYRQEIFSDFFYNESMLDKFSDALLALQTLENLQRYRISQPDDKKQQFWKMINFLKELQVYVEAVKCLKNVLSESSISSEGLIRLENILDQIYNESGFALLQKDIAGLTDDVSKIKSLTLGVNLDDNLNPTEVILTSVNEDTVKESKSIMSGFKEFIYKSAALNNGDFQLVHKMKQLPMTERSSLMLDLTKNIEQSLENIFIKMKKSLSKYVNLQGYGLIKIIPELKFYLQLVKLFKRLSENGFSVCKPALITDKTGILHMDGLYNVRLAFSMIETGKNEMITNDLHFDNRSNIYILTGPNRGGKTILTQAAGQAVVFMQLGGFVPCSAMEGSILSGIFSHFPADENDTLSYGRLGEEAMRIHSIIKKMNPNSLLLLNETYATTSFSDGLYMAKDLIRYLKFRGINCIYNTHMHELASDIESLNHYEGKGIVKSLVMGIEGGKRLYKVKFGDPDYNSHAMDIAIKYGVTFEQMLHPQG